MAKKELWSIFTDNMDKCIETDQYGVDRHHCMGGSKYKKAKCEEYGYIAPLIPKIHPNGAYHQHSNYTVALDKRLKKACCEDFIEKHGTEKDFIRIFGRSYL